MGGADDSKSKKKTELEKYWKAVKENPQDFTGWTYLLQFVEQENNVDWCREAFDAFFGHFPYCYGYWKKYSDLEKRNGNVDKAQQVYERGLKAIPLSVDLWLHFINFYKQEFEKNPGSEEKIRSIYERSLMAAGTEFRSDKLWEQYIQWEMSKKKWKAITTIYDRLLRIPTQLYKHHFEKFKEFVGAHDPREILEIDEFLKIRQEVTPTLESRRRDADDADPAVPGLDQPPGTESKPMTDAAETTAVRERVLEVRNVVYRLTEEEVSRRWNFEEGIRRPYFHVKPLERSQLRNWREYLDFEMEHGSHERSMVLFERCMIACAHYEDFWIKYANYMEQFSADAVRNIYKRACAVHLRKKPYIHTAWASFEERQGNLAQAREILLRLDRNMPGLALVAMRRIGLERRAGNNDAVDRLFRKHIDQADKPGLASFFTIKFARYLSMVQGNHSAARDVLHEGLQRDKNNPRLYLQLLELEMRGHVLSETNIMQVLNLALAAESLAPETKLLFSQRRMQFLEDFSTSVEKIHECYDEHQKLLKEVQSLKKKRGREEGKGSEEPDNKRARTDEGVQPMPVQDFFNSQNYYGYSGQYTGHGAAWTGYNTQYHTS